MAEAENESIYGELRSLFDHTMRIYRQDVGEPVKL